MKFKDLCTKLGEVKEGIENKSYVKENHYLDYKKLFKTEAENLVDKFLAQFAKDILGFSNKEGGIIILGVEEPQKGVYNGIGMGEKQIQAFGMLDTGDVGSRLDGKLSNKASVSIDLGTFEIDGKVYGYILIEKKHNYIFFRKDCKEWGGIEKNMVYHRENTSNKAAKTPNEIEIYLDNRKTNLREVSNPDVTVNQPSYVYNTFNQVTVPPSRQWDNTDAAIIGAGGVGVGLVLFSKNRIETKLLFSFLLLGIIYFALNAKKEYQTVGY
jgi:predicted HTH transcriptional regulator